MPQTRSCVDTGPLQKLLWISPHSPQTPLQQPDICTEAGQQKVEKEPILLLIRYRGKKYTSRLYCYSAEDWKLFNRRILHPVELQQKLLYQL